MASFAVPGATIDHGVSGEGDAVVQLHGLTSSRRRDRALGLDLASQLDDARVLSYDARGHGRSSGRQRPDDYRWESLADDLHDLVRQVFDSSQVHGVGGSMGAGTLLHAATRRPEVFASLTLVVPPTAWETRRAKTAEYETAARLVETRGLQAFIDAGDPTTLPPAAQGRPHTVPDVAEELFASIYRGAARSDLPARDALTDLDVPTLVLAWIDDPAHPMSTAEQLCDLLPRSRLVTARRPDDVATWSAELARHVARHG